MKIGFALAFLLFYSAVTQSSVSYNCIQENNINTNYNEYIKLENCRDDKKNNGTFGITEFFTLLALIFSIGSYFYTQYKTRKEQFSNQVKSINDDFWLRTVIIPNFIEPIVALLKNSPQKFVECNNNITDFYKNYYKDESNRIRDRTVFFHPISEKLQENLLLKIDDLDDDLFDLIHQENIKLEEPLAKFLSGVVELIKLEQIRQAINS